MVRRTVRERAVCVACPRLGREVVVSLHIRVYYERAGLRGDGDVQIREPELATLVRVVEEVRCATKSLATFSISFRAAITAPWSAFRLQNFA